MQLTHSNKTLSCRTLLGCGIFICSPLILSGCGTFIGKSSSAKVAQFKQDTSVGTEDISIAAVGLVDVPYRFGGNTPKGGFDCSGLIVYVYSKAAGIKLPRTIQLMSTRGRSIDDQPPAPGDLVFFNTTGEKYSHAGIYVGQGRFVHAPSAGGTVRLDYITTPYWAAKFTEARRLTPQ
ncbi:C40 family peptidase [Polynucleobacter necessarius]|uniref:C40 family peptidase n=1 Tax=Polynucleobacter necessarius TaxID=576610 RepID=UPI000E08FB75